MPTGLWDDATITWDDVGVVWDQTGAGTPVVINAPSATASASALTPTETIPPLIIPPGPPPDKGSKRVLPRKKRRDRYWS